MLMAAALVCKKLSSACNVRGDISMSDNEFEQRGQVGNTQLERGQNAERKQPEPSARTGSRRGFAAMDQQTQREIARKGGHSQGKENNRGNFWHDRERARIAGRKGGEAHGKNRQESAPDLERQ
jgi:general stress protein YciG